MNTKPTRPEFPRGPHQFSELRVILPWANAFADGEPKAAGLADDSDET